VTKLNAAAAGPAATLGSKIHIYKKPELCDNVSAFVALV